MTPKRSIALILAVVLAFSLFGCRKAGGDDDKKDNGKNETAAADLNADAVWTDTTTVTHGMFIYYFNAYYRSFLEDYSDYLDVLGLDPSKSLMTQEQSEDYNWQQYMTLQVYRQLREMIALADAAKAEGMTLSKEDKADIDDQIANYTTLAAEAKMSTADYIEKVYGDGVTEDIMRKANELRYLANKYYTKLWDGYEFSEDECAEYYEKNRDSFLHFDYIKNTVPAKDAEKLKKCTDEESFINTMREIITKNNFLNDYDRFADTIEAQLQRKYVYRASYNKDSAFCKWAFQADREPYDIHTKKESSGDVTVAMLLPTDELNTINGILYRDDVPLKGVKYIFFEKDESDATAATTKAETIYKNWQEDPTEEHFDELVEKFKGGTAEEINRGDFAEELIDWIFDKDREEGDVGVVHVDVGSYILYQLPDGEASWISEVRKTLSDEQYTKDMNALMDKYPVDYEPDIVYNVKEVSVNATTSQSEK